MVQSFQSHSISQQLSMFCCWNFMIDIQKKNFIRACLRRRVGQGEVYKPTSPPPSEQLHNSINELTDSDCKSECYYGEIWCHVIDVDFKLMWLIDLLCWKSVQAETAAKKLCFHGKFRLPAKLLELVAKFESKNGAALYLVYLLPEMIFDLPALTSLLSFQLVSLRKTSISKCRLWGRWWR